MLTKVYGENAHYLISSVWVKAINFLCHSLHLANL